MKRELIEERIEHTGFCAEEVMNGFVWSRHCRAQAFEA